MKKKNMENQKKALEWWIVKRIDAGKVNLIEEGIKIGINEVISIVKLLITV